MVQRYWEREPLTARAQVRLTQAEKERVTEEADLAALTISDFVRRRALGRTVTASIDLLIIRELSRIGGLLKHIHLVSGGAYREDTAATLAAVRACMHRISAERPGRERPRPGRGSATEAG